jgi:hypothetical protein
VQEENEEEIDVPDGVIAHLTKECGGNMHGRRVVEVTSSGTANDEDPNYAAKNAADLESRSCFHSSYH